MAAPHITGVAALLLSIPFKCDFNNDGVVSPAEVKQRLENTALDLGVSGKDEIYGAGLINAYSAIQ
jgi:Subtilase family.